jgi:hypothetical protein
MSAQKRTRIVAIFVVASAAALIFTLSIGAASVSAAAKKGDLQVTKECPPTTYTGAAGDFCTITSSNLAEIEIGSKIFYDQAANTPAGMLDSNIVLVVGTGDWAVGRCTLDLTTFLGVCTLSDGTGPLAGIHARVDVSYAGSGSDFAWEGTYSFSPHD